MNGKIRRIAALFPFLLCLLICLAILLLSPSPALAQFAGTPDTVDQDQQEATDAAVPLSAEDLNALVAPVALYPDDLLAIVLPAATNPLQIVEAQRFLDKQKADPSLQPDETWDPAIVALLNYPDVVKHMNDDLSWTQDLGNAIMDQQDDVLQAIQTARSAASEAGYLKSNDQQVVVNDNDTIVIKSAEPDVVYVPTYDPAPIVNNTYVSYPPPIYSPPYPAYYAPGATFVAGAVVGAAFMYAFDWHDNDIDIDCCGHGDIDIDNDFNVSRGDVNIGSGNVNIDKTKLQNKFSGKNKAGGQGGMQWSPQKAREKSTVQRKAKTQPTSAGISQKLSGGTGKQNLAKTQGNFKSGKAVERQSQRGQNSLSTTKKTKQQIRQNAGTKKQVQQRQLQSSQKKMQPKQLKQKKGGSFQQMPSRNTAKAHSNRGNRSMGSGGRSRRR